MSALPTLTEQGFCGMIYEGNFGTVSVHPHKFIRFFQSERNEQSYDYCNSRRKLGR